MAGQLWRIDEGDGPVLGTAIHAGHSVRDSLEEQMAISEPQRLREEDPYTAAAIAGIPTRIRVARSRFEIDLNRDEHSAVYGDAQQSWGLVVWNDDELEEDEKKISLAIHQRYYSMLEALLGRIVRLYGRFVLLDVHSYNHRRGGPDAAPTPAEQAPEVNVGTCSMDRERWSHIVDPFLEYLATADFRGRKLDVGENIAFQGRGEQTRFVHDYFPVHGCAIAIEFKKFYMDEWTGKPDYWELMAMKQLLEGAVPVLLQALGRGRKK